jgi:hypothetical protein
VKQYKTCLAVIVLASGLAAPSAAQQVSFVPDTSASDPCAEYFGCLHYGTLTEAQARTARGHPEFVEAPSQTEPRPGAMASRAAEAPSARPVARQ